MYTRILVPVDGSETSNKALAAALQMARDSGGRVRLLHAFDELAYLPVSGFGGNISEMARERAAKILADGLKSAEEASVPADSELLEVPGRRFGDVVADEARKWQADLIVIGTHGRRGLDRLVLGSGAEQVTRMAPVPVLTIRGESES
jgi:nucleotide-binding universal stress UspA family protein